jgi:hypothetical protein
MKTSIKNDRDSILEYLQDLSNDEKVQIHNTYCQEIGDGDDEIHENDEEFFNTYFESDVMGAVRAASFGNYNYSQDYIKFNGYGNLDTFSNPDEYIDLDAIADNILENPAAYDIDLEDEDEDETV